MAGTSCQTMSEETEAHKKAKDAAKAGPGPRPSLDRCNCIEHVR